MSLPPGFDQTATFYSRTAGSGPYNLVVSSGVRCRLAHVNQQPAATGAQRAELAAIRNLMWDPAFAPTTESLQVQVDGVTGPDGATPARWGLVAGTLATMRGPDGSAVYRRADVRRQV